MSADKIIIEPEGFKEQKGNFNNAAAEVGGIEISCDYSDINLASLERFKECVDYLNTTFKEFAALINNDCRTLEQILNEWKKLDEKKAKELKG